MVDVQRLLDDIKPRFVSGNSIPVERAHITQAEWAALLAIAEAYNAAPVGVVRETGGSLCLVGGLLCRPRCPVSVDETVRLVREVEG